MSNNNNKNQTSENRPRISLRRDALISTLIALGTFCLFIAIDFTETWYEFTRDYEDYELDETLGLVLGTAVALLFFNTRLLIFFRRERKHAIALSKEMQVQALTDHLTQLPNRRAIAECTEQLIERSAKSKTPFTLMYVDLDSFKYVNDALGHDVGDKLLVQVTERLSLAKPDHAVLSRIGGDEFCLLIAGETSIDQCLELCNQLNRAVAEPYVIDGHKLHVSQTIGLAQYPDDGESFGELLKVADVAMFMGKDKDATSSNFIDDSFFEDMQNRFIVQHDLDDALAQGQFYVEYQAKVDMDQGNIIGSEALVRWRHPEHGMMRPDKFIHIAEETHAIKRIDMFVLETVCKQINEWGSDARPVAINLSPSLFADENLPQEISALLEKFSVTPDMIELEITERTMFADSDVPAQICQSLVDLGFKLSLDDFGTGYSSLSHIANFPITTLKLDRSFIAKAGDDDRNLNIVNSVIGLSQALGIRTVAEGIETNEQCMLMRNMGCDEGQGYFFAKPASATEYFELSLKHR